LKSNPFVAGCRTLDRRVQKTVTLRTAKLLVTVPDISNPSVFLVDYSGHRRRGAARGDSVLVGDTQRDSRREEGYALMVKRKEADG
jgi:LacI family repressor for deo operon, udp, cdd, tsx, nupC, and nupG